MRQKAALCALAVVVCSVTAGSARAAQATPARGSTFGRFTVEAKSWGGDIQGPWEFSKDVKVTSSDLTMTCDRLKAWPTKDGRDWERVEATGNIAISGRYVAADKTGWQVTGKADSASYDAKAGQGVLKGSVQFKAVNSVTGATISAVADKLTYDVKTRQFQFERGERPVRVEWEQPEQAQPEGAAGGQQTGKSDTGK